ncbi:MAG TPA: 4-hydroxy-tetrahydrodipicolinate synthase [Flavobacteriaceae bacterium]|nr:4-hydroxy-tetrahydrodipicolinate synthase [Flavobacteriaceae bacterium]
MKDLKGMGVALITPFKPDKSIDKKALRKLVQFQLDNGTDYIVVLGTTGEYATISDKEREEIKEIIIEENAGKLPLVLGIGGNDTKGVKGRLQKENTKGFDAILSVSPYYNKPSQEGIYQHFKALSEVAPLPLIVYNVPGRTSSNILPETISRIAKDFDNIIGIKEAAGDMVQAMKMIDQTPDDFLIISGEDMIALPMVLAGGDGVISVIGQGFPKAFSKMINLGLEGKVKEAYQIHYSIAPAIDMVFEEGNPSGIKAVFHQLEMTEQDLRLPLVPVSENLKNKLATFTKKFYS